MSLDLVLGQIKGIDVSVGDLIAKLETMDPDQVLGELDGETLTVAEGLRRLQRTALLPKMVPIEDRIPDSEWAEAVIVRGEAPYGRCPFCQTAKSAAGCLNLCDMPAALAQAFTDGLMEVINRNRGHSAWLEALGGCTCGPARYTGYETQRSHHDYRCPMATGNH